MRHVLLVLCVLLVGTLAFGQVSLNRQTIFNGTAYTTSDKDTSDSYRLAAAKSLALVLITADTISADVYVDYSLDLTTWTNKLADSVIVTDGAATVSEYSIKDNDSDLLDGIYGYLRVRIAQRASGTAVAGTFIGRFYYP